MKDISHFDPMVSWTPKHPIATPISSNIATLNHSSLENMGFNDYYFFFYGEKVTKFCNFSQNHIHCERHSTL